MIADLEFRLPNLTTSYDISQFLIDPEKPAVALNIDWKRADVELLGGKGAITPPGPNKPKDDSWWSRKEYAIGGSEFGLYEIGDDTFNGSVYLRFLNSSDGPTDEQPNKFNKIWDVPCKGIEFKLNSLVFSPERAGYTNAEELRDVIFGMYVLADIAASGNGIELVDRLNIRSASLNLEIDGENRRLFDVAAYQSKRKDIDPSLMKNGGIYNFVVDFLPRPSYRRVLEAAAKIPELTRFILQDDDTRIASVLFQDFIAHREVVLRVARELIKLHGYGEAVKSAGDRLLRRPYSVARDNVKANLEKAGLTQNLDYLW